jgi:DNA-binding CsgD family transcriptional regulator
MINDSDLIAAIYNAVLDPSGWEEIVGRVVQATKSAAGFLANRGTDAGELTALFNADPFYADLYGRHYYKINPLDAIGTAIAPGNVRSVTSITQTDAFKASAFCNDIMRPQGWADCVCVGLFHRPGEYGLLVLDRSPGALWVDPREWQLLESLGPHLKRAAEVRHLLAQARAATDSLGAAVAAAGFAIFLLTQDCHVLFANSKAEDLLRRGIGLHHEKGRLATATPALTQRLRALARVSTRPGQGGGEMGGSLELPRGGGGRPLIAHVFPLAANRAVIFDVDRPAAALFVMDPAANLAAQVRRFAAKFGLTDGESRVLGEIIGGQGLLAAAARLKITEATARTHAKHILSKTETHRQTELIRRFFETSFSGTLDGK